MEGVYIEEIDNEIIVTNLQMHSFPIIRYKLGDYIKLASKSYKCNCGINHSIIDEVTGRIGENIYGKSNTYPSLYFYYIFKNLSKNDKLFLNYQVIQREKGMLIFNLESKISFEEEKKIKTEIEKYFKKDINFEIKQEVNFIMDKGKLKNFISKVNE